MIPKSGHAGATIKSDDGGSEKLGKSPEPITTTHSEQRKGLRDSIFVKWLDSYYDKMDKYWSRLPNFIGSAAATIAIFLLGLCFRGEWMLIFVHFARRWGYAGENVTMLASRYISSDEGNASHSIIESLEKLLPETPYLRNFTIAYMVSTIVSYTIYFSMGGFLHWYYYVSRRDRAEEWKCQPYKWLPPNLEKHEIILGVSSLIVTNFVTSVLATYLIYGYPSMVYYGFDEYTWTWWFLQWPIIYLILDYETYWFHRLYHFPMMYKMFHKLHHTYKQPTAWSATAIHPVEIVHMQLCYIVPLFAIPTHLIPYCTIMIYNFIHGILDHSGINFKAQWWQPWQPDASFHDNHHQYTHVNFGFNMFFWDKLHGTYRLKDRVYNEDIFFGKGIPLEEATKELLETDIRERDSENVDNKIIYSLSGEIVDHAKTE